VDDVELDTIRYAVRDGLATITLARPEKRNALDAAMFRRLGDVAEAASSDPEVRALLLDAEGPAFCAGLDLSAIGEIAALHGAAFRSFVRTAQRPFLHLARMPKPTVAAVQGHAVGAGFQLALACDLRVVADDVRFAMLEARYGLVPDLGGLHHLARLVGPGRAKELVWTTRSMEVDEAMRTGLANRAVPTAELAEAASALVREAMAWSPTAAALSKSLLARASETSLEAELERVADAQAQCLSGQDHRESVAAFLERRPPSFGAR
jgi:enoyl-CoA hydratase/carnithine racemase